MKIRPVILCGGAGTRLWPDSKKNLPKQFINFGGWNLFKKTLERINNSTYDYPIISTNKKYLKEIKKNLNQVNITKYKIILETAKKNTASAVLVSTLINEIPYQQPLMFFTSDHLIEKSHLLNAAIIKNRKFLTDKNIFVFGIKPLSPSSEYGYFTTKKGVKNVNIVKKFVEKPNLNKAKKIIKEKGYWNSGMFFSRKDAIIKFYKKYQPNVYINCLNSILLSKKVNNIYTINKFHYSKIKSNSFDYAILEKIKDINAIKLDIPWSDLGSWKEICKMYNKNKAKLFNNKYNKLKATYFRPWGRYVNLFKGKGFLVKEILVNHKGCLSLQKHHHRSEHWLITQGVAKITLNKKILYKKVNDNIFLPVKSIHRVENIHKTQLKIIEAQIGSILKETDIVRFDDIYGRVK
tara:strand:+ start:3880 stop:5100 length:1221 start_codon:yes stop_codon:yes gene_type:complete